MSARPEQELLSDLALASFRLNGQFLEVAETLARPAGLTAAWWQVLGAVLAILQVALAVELILRGFQRLGALPS